MQGKGKVRSSWEVEVVGVDELQAACCSRQQFETSHPVTCMRRGLGKGCCLNDDDEDINFFDGLH